MRVAIIGGGIGGLAAAIALSAPGREIVVHERAEALGDVGAGVQLSPNAVRALEALGVAEAVRERAVAPEAIELRRGRDDRLLVRTPLTGAAAPYWHARRSDLQAVLLEAARARGVAVRLGDAAEVEALDADLVVAADGVRSAARALLNGAAAARFTGAMAWRGTVPLREAPHALVAAVRLGAGRHFVSYRVGGEAMNFVGVVASRDPTLGERWSQAGDPAALLRDFGDWPGVRALVEACGAPSLWALYDREVAARWSDGRVVLLGDAAHPVPPHLAQGAALALEDAVVLGGALAAAPLAEALRRYEDARRGRVARVLAASRRQGRLLQLGGVAGIGSHAALAVAGALAPGLPTRSLSWLYGYDPATGAL